MRSCTVLAEHSAAEEGMWAASVLGPDWPTGPAGLELRRLAGLPPRARVLVLIFWPHFREDTV